MSRFFCPIGITNYKVEKKSLKGACFIETLHFENEKPDSLVTNAFKEHFFFDKTILLISEQIVSCVKFGVFLHKHFLLISNILKDKFKFKNSFCLFSRL